MKIIRIDGEIDAGTASGVSQAFDSADGEDVALRIASPGGSVMDGQRIVAAMRRHPGQIEAEVEFAFSMAANLALEADKLRMPSDSFLMFHAVSAATRGPAAAHERTADVARRMDMETAYKLSGRTGWPAQDVVAQLPGEIWLNGSQALEAGLIDELLPARRLAARFEAGDYEQLPAQLCLDCAAASATNRGMSELLDSIKARFGPSKVEPGADPAPNDFESRFEALEARMQEQTDCISYLRDVVATQKEEIAEAQKSAKAQAYRAISQAGHDPVALSESVTVPETVASQYEALCREVENGVPGAALKRREFRQRHKHELKA